MKKIEQENKILLKDLSTVESIYTREYIQSQQAKIIQKRKQEEEDEEEQRQQKKTSDGTKFLWTIFW